MMDGLPAVGETCSSRSHDNITLVTTTGFFKLGPLDVNIVI